METGKQIRKYRSEAGLSQEMLAEKIYVPDRRYQTGRTIRVTRISTAYCA